MSQTQGRTRPQKYQNRFAFRDNKNSRKSKHIKSLPTGKCCKRCSAIIQWRKKYHKYKPLTQLRKCAKCGQKNVRFAYHIWCDRCAIESKSCPKCMKVMVEEDYEEGGDEVDLSGIKLNDIDLEDERETELEKTSHVDTSGASTKPEETNTNSNEQEQNGDTNTAQRAKRKPQSEPLTKDQVVQLTQSMKERKRRTILRKMDKGYKVFVEDLDSMETASKKRKHGHEHDNDSELDSSDDLGEDEDEDDSDGD